MKLDTVDTSAAVVMYTIVAEATVQALTALDQDKGVVSSKYSYGDTSVCAVMRPPGLEVEHEGGGEDPTAEDAVAIIDTDTSRAERLETGEAGDMGDASDGEAGFAGGEGKGVTGGDGRGGESAAGEAGLWGNGLLGYQCRRVVGQL